MKRLPFSEMVERRMKDKGLSLRAVCREAKLDASFFSKVLSGKRSPPSEESVLRKLATVLEVDAIELIVATGRIPSEWQPLFKDPAVLASLSRMVGGAVRPTAPVHRPTAPPPHRSNVAVPTATHAFSDELL